MKIYVTLIKFFAHHHFLPTRFSNKSQTAFCSGVGATEGLETKKNKHQTLLVLSETTHVVTESDLTTDKRYLLAALVPNIPFRSTSQNWIVGRYNFTSSG